MVISEILMYPPVVLEGMGWSLLFHLTMFRHRRRIGRLLQACFWSTWLLTAMYIALFLSEDMLHPYMSLAGTGLIFATAIHRLMMDETKEKR